MTTHETLSIGRYINQPTVNDLVDSLCKAKYLEVKKLPKRKITIYVTHDLGYGYMNHMSIRFLRECVALNKLNEDVPLTCKYMGGNIFTYLKTSVFDKEILKTDETYVFVNDATQEIYNIKIGKPTNPNTLYFYSELADRVFTLEQTKRIEGINAVWVEEDVTLDFI